MAVRQRTRPPGLARANRGMAGKTCSDRRHRPETVRFHHALSIHCSNLARVWAAEPAACAALLPILLVAPRRTQTYIAAKKPAAFPRNSAGRKSSSSSMVGRATRSPVAGANVLPAVGTSRSGLLGKTLVDCVRAKRRGGAAWGFYSGNTARSAGPPQTGDTISFPVLLRCRAGLLLPSRLQDVSNCSTRWGSVVSPIRSTAATLTHENGPAPPR